MPSKINFLRCAVNAEAAPGGTAEGLAGKPAACGGMAGGAVLPRAVAGAAVDAVASVAPGLPGVPLPSLFALPALNPATLTLDP